MNLSCEDSYDEIIESSQKVVVSELFAKDVLEVVVSLLEISQLKILLVVIKALQIVYCVFFLLRWNSLNIHTKFW